MDSSDDDYVLEQQAGYLLRRANQRHAALFAKHFAPFDLTPLQFAVLMKLLASGPLSQNHLGRLTAMDPNTAQGVILRLLRRRLVARRPSPEDRRRKLLSLTEAGLALAARLTVEGRAISEATLAPLAARERRQLLALLAKLV